MRNIRSRGARPPGLGRLTPLLVLVAMAGCGYSVRPPYEPAVRTVYVPVFRSISFVRDLNLELTRMVQQEIERRTPFKVVGSPEGADTTLDGTIFFVENHATVENPNNLPRQILSGMAVNVRWTDNRTGASTEQAVPAVGVVEYLPFFPELGETSDLGYEKVLRRLARDIVNMMEEPW